MKPVLRLILVLTSLLGGCSDVPYHARRNLSRRVMVAEPNELEVKFQNKTLASREVSGGRPGNSAGGGCGCGN